MNIEEYNKAILVTTVSAIVLAVLVSLGVVTEAHVCTIACSRCAFLRAGSSGRRFPRPTSSECLPEGATSIATACAAFFLDAFAVG